MEDNLFAKTIGAFIVTVAIWLINFEIINFIFNMMANSLGFNWTKTATFGIMILKFINDNVSFRITLNK